MVIVVGSLILIGESRVVSIAYVWGFAMEITKLPEAAPRLPEVAAFLPGAIAVCPELLPLFRAWLQLSPRDIARQEHQEHQHNHRQ